MSQYVRHDLVVNPKRGEALPANATKGFIWVPNSAGNPGTPSAPESNVTPIIYDSTAKVLKFWDGAAWKSTEGTSGTGGGHDEEGLWVDGMWVCVRDVANEGNFVIIPKHPDRSLEDTSIMVGTSSSVVTNFRGYFAGSVIIEDSDTNHTRGNGSLSVKETVTAGGFTAKVSGTDYAGVTSSHTVVEGLYFSGGKLYAYLRTVEVKNGIITSWPTGSVSGTLVSGQ